MDEIEYIEEVTFYIGYIDKKQLKEQAEVFVNRGYGKYMYNVLERREYDCSVEKLSCLDGKVFRLRSRLK